MYDKQNKDSINNLFQNISTKYDLINDLMSFGLHRMIKRNAVKNIDKNDASMIVDLCTGTGDILLFLNKQYPHSDIVGIDFSTNMLEIAEKRIKNKKNILLKKMDITNIDLEPNTFDICFISFGLRNLPNIKQTIEDIKKILKPNGVISILDLGKPNSFIKPFFNIYFNRIVPLIGRVFNKDKNPYIYLINSVRTYPSQAEIIEMLENMGFENCKSIDYAFGIISQQIGTKK